MFSTEEECQEIREDKSYVTLSEARKAKYVIRFNDFKQYIIKPKNINLGIRVFKKYPLSELISFIDWNPFFSVYQLRGTYPNRNYPKLFNDKNVGKAAKELFNDAKKMLNEWISSDNNIIEARGVIGFYECM